MPLVSVCFSNKRSLIIKFSSIPLSDNNGYLSDYIQLTKAGQRSLVNFGYVANTERNRYAFAISKFDSRSFPNLKDVTVDILGPEGRSKDLKLQVDDNVLFDPDIEDVVNFVYKDGKLLFRITFKCDIEYDIIPNPTGPRRREIDIEILDTDRIIYANWTVPVVQTIAEVRSTSGWFPLTLNSKRENIYEITVDVVSNYLRLSLKCDNEEFLAKTEVMAVLFNGDRMLTMANLLSSNMKLQFAINISYITPEIEEDSVVKFMIVFDKQLYLRKDNESYYSSNFAIKSTKL